MSDETLVLTDHQGRKIRLMVERRMHILGHPELKDQFERIRETVEKPTVIVVTPSDETVHVYHRYHASTPVTSKYLLVIVKILEEDAFVLTAFFSSRQKKGIRLWQA